MNLGGPLTDAALVDDGARALARRREDSRRLEGRIATVLRSGVLSAAALLAVGLPWVVFGRPPGKIPDPSVGKALAGLRSLDPEALAALGVVVLVATPILQLLTSAVLFWRKHDRLYLALTLLVCGIVALGALGAGGGG